MQLAAPSEVAPRIRPRLCLMPGAWCLVPGAWCLVPGAWCLVPGAWCLVPGAWCLVPGLLLHHRYMGQVSHLAVEVQAVADDEVGGISNPT